MQIVFFMPTVLSLDSFIIELRKLKYMFIIRFRCWKLMRANLALKNRALIVRACPLTRCNRYRRIRKPTTISKLQSKIIMPIL